MIAPDDDDVDMTDEDFDRAMLTAEPVKLIDPPVVRTSYIISDASTSGVIVAENHMVLTASNAAAISLSDERRRPSVRFSNNKVTA